MRGARDLHSDGAAIRGEVTGKSGSRRGGSAPPLGDGWRKKPLSAMAARSASSEDDDVDAGERLKGSPVSGVTGLLSLRDGKSRTLGDRISGAVALVRGARRRRRAHRQRRDHLEVLQAAPPLVQLERRLLRPAGRPARRLAAAVGCCCPCCRRRVVLGRLLGAGEHLDDLLERGGVGLDEGGGERGGVDGARDGPRGLREFVGLLRTVVVRVRWGGGGRRRRRGGRGRGVGVPLMRHGEELLGGNLHWSVWVLALVGERRGPGR